MGGCRCYFRECHVTSKKFPGTHFFRFPIKEAERFRKWRQYSQMDQILEFSAVRRKNTCICLRHFRSECFMNYKMDRLTATAVPTIMRLSDDKALDFELDTERGVLVDIEKPKLKHLIPPDGFECPLFLTNDKILQEMLNEVQDKQYNRNEQIELITLEEGECDELLEASKILTNSMETLETIQVVTPSLKRPRQNRNEEKVFSGTKDKKCRILNTSNCAGGNDAKKVSTVVLESMENDEVESEDIHFVETIQMENVDELVNDDGQLFLTSESFINDDCDEDIEIFQVHKNANDLHSDLSLTDSDAHIVEIKSQVTDPDNIEIINVEKRLIELDKVKQDFDALLVKYSILETENKELRENCQQTDQIKKNQLLLQVENNNLKKSLKDCDSMREKLHKYSEENQKLKNEATNNKALKAELLTRKEETKELKKLLETLRNVDSERENIELEIKQKEINVLRKKLELLQQQLNDAVDEMKEVQTNLNNMENENKKLILQENQLKKSLEVTQKKCDFKQTEYNELKSNFVELQLKQTILEQKYLKLQALQSQESTVSTSLERDKTETLPAAAPAPPLTKSQFFNGIKRYLCSSMVSLLRMEMFGNTEREWKPDERQVAVDILRLGERAYKYFTDEWRIRLPALRDAREWLSQSQQLMEDEEDL